MPSMPGSPRSRITTSGGAGGQRQRGLACRGEVDLVPARLEVRAERAEELWLVVDHEDAGHVCRLST